MDIPDITFIPVISARFKLVRKIRTQIQKNSRPTNSKRLKSSNFNCTSYTWVATSRFQNNRVIPVVRELTGSTAFRKLLLCLVLRSVTYVLHSACWRAHAVPISCGKKSLHIIEASIALKFGVHAGLHAPFNASAVIKSLIKLMLDLSREPGVGERYDGRHHQPSASDTRVSQPISPHRRSVQAELEQAFVSVAH